MSAGLQCVHPNFAALYETAANWTTMYNWHEVPQEHARIFFNVLDGAIKVNHLEETKFKSASQKQYVDVFYNWDLRARYWEAFLTSIANSNEPVGIPREEWVYRV